MNVLHLCMASRSASLNSVTMPKIDAAAYFMRKDAVSQHIATIGNLCYGRKKASQDAILAEYGEPRESVRVLFIDDDIQILNSPEELASIFLEAEAKDMDIAANYPIATGQPVVFRDINHRFASEELKRLAEEKDFEPLPEGIGSLGFYYGKVFWDYNYHIDSEKEEVTHFFEENRHRLNLHLATRIRLAHKISWWRSDWMDFDSGQQNAL